MATSEKQHQRDRVTLCGSFGLGNAGDDAAYLAVEDLARALGLQVEFDVATRFPVADDPSVLSLGPADAERRASLRGQPLLYLGGGIIEPRESATLFRTRRLVRELRPDDCNLFAASADSHRFVQYDWSARLALLGVLRHCRRLFARDVLSAETIRMLAPFRRVEVVGDIVLWMNPDGDPPPQIAALGRYITVSLAGVWRGEITWYEWLSRQLAEIARSLDAAVVFLPFCTRETDDDRTEHARVADRLRRLDPSVRVLELDPRPPIRQAATIQEHALLAIGMRLHACVMAYARRTPAVGLTYHAKMHGFARTVGWERFFPCAPSPARHGTQRYGFSFADTGLAECRLTRLAREALEHADFDKLGELRDRLAQAFADCLGVTLRSGALATCPEPASVSAAPPDPASAAAASFPSPPSDCCPY